MSRPWSWRRASRPREQSGRCSIPRTVYCVEPYYMIPPVKEKFVELRINWASGIFGLLRTQTVLAVDISLLGILAPFIYDVAST